MLSAELLSLYKTAKETTGYVVGERAKGALRLAKDALQAEALGLEVKFEQDEYFSIGDQGDFITDEAFAKGLRSGRFEVLCAYVKGFDGTYLASLGGIVVDWRDRRSAETYLRGFELELLSEALHALKSGQH